jgi:tryptophan halogenase
VNPFNKNVCAVGLSAGFIEPLEATSLFLSQYNIMRFNDVISNNRNPEVFNRSQSQLIDEIYLYTLAHYTLAKGTDNEYWKHYSDLESRLQTEKLVRQKAQQPDVGKWAPSTMFFPYSWWALLQGYGLTND